VFHDAWTFGAVCLFVAGLGCLLVGHVKPGEVPVPGQVSAPGDAASGDAARGNVARAVLAETEPQRTLRAPRPRPRRVIALDAGGPAAPRAESAAEFLARSPLFSGLDPELVEQLTATSPTRHRDR
jgi:hypothetical protein